MPRSAGSETVLIRAPAGRDAELMHGVLTQHGLAAHVCATNDELRERIAEDAGCAVVTEEALDRTSAASLAEDMDRQPPWSDFPLVVLGAALTPIGKRPTFERLSELGNVTWLDRPVKARTLVAAVHVALRGRRRQYAAQRAIQQRDDFLAMLGHELRNPLGGVVLAAEMIHRSAGRPADVARHLAMIDRQTRTLTRLVDDLLDVSRVTSGKVALRREPVALDDVLQRSVQLIEPDARAHALQLAYAPDGGAALVHGDPVRLEQVFLNLLKNAVKYSPAGAHVTIRSRADGDHAEVSVRDTGIGMAPEMLDRAFDLFTQAPGALDRADGGMGIGLTLVKSLVEMHGGTVTAHSAGLGHGSTLIVRLPLIVESATPAVAAPRPPAGPEPAPRQGLLHVVLVEDNADLRVASQDALEELGCRVEVAADGPRGLESILTARPDLALVDIGLPLMDGYEVARVVRQQLGSGPVLVALTGYGQPQDRQRALDAGFDAHLTKPVTIRTLREALALAPRRADEGRE